MAPRDVARELLKAVEAESGFPVYVREGVNQATVTSLRLARDPLPAHMIAYQPAGKRVLDYLICYQCNFLLRHSATPSEARGNVTAPIGGVIEDHLRNLPTPG